MKERLTKRTENGVKYETEKYVITCYPENNNLNKVDKLAVKLCEYEDLEEAGLLVRLPCKVGDRLYSIPFGDSRQIFEHTVTGFALFVVSKTEEGDRVETNFEWFGDHALLTREEAEKRLEELKGEME